MNVMCTDNRFELIERFKQRLINGTNIETAPDEMAVLDNILFRFWQMGWLDKLEQPTIEPERIKFIQEAVNTLMNTSKTNSIKDKCFRNAARFVQNAIDGEPQDFELIPDEPERKTGKWVYEVQDRLADETDDGRVYRKEKRWKCSECGYDKGFVPYKPKDKFCVECGAKMEVEG